MAASEHPPPGLGRPRRPRLGELLLERGQLTQAQLEGALILQRQWGTNLGRVVVARGYCTDAQLMSALSTQLGFPVVDLDAREVNPRASELLSLADAERLRAVPFALEGDRHEELQVAFAAPAKLDVQDEVRVLAGKPRVKAFLCGDEVLERAIGRAYRHERPGAPAARTPLRETALESGVAGEPVVFEASATPAPVAPPAPAPLPAAVAAPAGAAPAEGVTRTPAETSSVMDALQLTPACVRVIRRAAADNQVTPREVMRRVLEAWAEPYRGDS